VKTPPLKLAIEIWPVSKPQPYGKNPRKPSDRAVAKVAASLKEFGWRQPIVVDKDGVIVAGHKRREVAISLGLTEVPEPAASQPDAYHDAERAQQREIVRRGLSRLGEKERTALVLRDVEGLSTREVAGILGSSENTVRSQISTARLKLRDFTGRLLRRRS